MFRIVPFKVEHLECMDMRTHEKNLLQDSKAVHLLAQASCAETMIEDGRIIGCGGYVPVNGQSKAIVWLIPSIYTQQAKPDALRYVFCWVKNISKHFAVLETYSVEDDLHNKWMKYLGFTKENVIKQYYNNVDYGLWRKYGS